MTTTRARWAVFADGQVGIQVLEILKSKLPSDVVATITIPGTRCSAVAHGLFPAARGLTSDDIRTESGRAQLRGVDADLFFLAWWPFVLKSDILDLGQKYTVNMHPSLLPHGRGKDPNFWCIVEQRPIGVTLHHVSQAIDAGDIAFQSTLNATWEDTGETIYVRSQRALVELFGDVIIQLSSLEIPRVKQQLALGSHHRRNELEPASAIDLDAQYTARDLLNLLRARTFSGHPACRFSDGGEQYEITVKIARTANV
jgi:methionyl-tRNA formyltransferase